MIQLQYVPRPAELTDEIVQQLTTQFKSDSSQRVWHKPYILRDLLKMSSDKCCYCECKVTEESKYLEVEHFHPKKNYEDEVVLWENLLPSCKHCNGNKRDHDTKVEPIIHPVWNDPREHLAFRSYRFYGKTELGKRSIRVLVLNDRQRLVMKRAKIGIKVKESLDELEELVEDYLSHAPVPHKRNRILVKLRGIMIEGQPSEEYSATVATEILTEDSYHFAKTQLYNLGLWDEEFERLENGLLKIAYR